MTAVDVGTDAVVAGVVAGAGTSSVVAGGAVRVVVITGGGNEGSADSESRSQDAATMTAVIISIVTPARVLTADGVAPLHP